jgi:putative addiction module component (TIGR02574 family)
MITVEKQLASIALGLPPKRRAKLAELLLQSLEGKREEELAELWNQEAESRSAAYHQGKLKAVPVEEAFDFKA